MPTKAQNIIITEYRSDPSKARRTDLTGSPRAGDEVVPSNSPDGRAAMPHIKPKGLIILMISVLMLVIIASIVVAAVWGMPAGALVLVFGTGLTLIGNPAIWATSLRTKERHSSAS
jgi:hypothetical protein